MSVGQNLTNPSKLIVSPLKMVAFLLSTATSGRQSQTYCYCSYDAYCKRRLLKLRQNEESESLVQVAFCPLLLSYCMVQPNNIIIQFCKSSVNKHFSLRRLTLGNYRHCNSPTLSSQSFYPLDYARLHYLFSGQWLYFYTQKRRKFCLFLIRTK